MSINRLHSLAERLRSEIQEQGPISFARFIEYALLDPAEGYYAAGRARVGKSGDFYTNVSVGPAFARIIAWQFAEMWHAAGCPTDWFLIEQGANDGQFAHDFLTALATDAPDVFNRSRVVLVEPFARNQQKQAERLAPWAKQIDWTLSLSNLKDLSGLHFTNEFVDALPVHLLIHKNTSWMERGVAMDGDAFTFVEIPLTKPTLPAGLPENVPDGTIAEVRPAAITWIQDVAKILRTGWILVADYGFPAEELYAPWRSNGTYTAYRNHQRQTDVLANPGSQDITAHVNFTDLAAAGLQSGLKLAGFTDQYHFLVGAAESLLNQPHPQSPSFIRQFKTLIHPQTMGTQFKFLALGKSISAPLSGFQYARPAALGVR